MEPHHQLDLFKNVPVEPKQLELFAYPPPPPPPGQLEMFPEQKFRSKRRDELVMSVEELAEWKGQIYNYQMRSRETPPAKQAALFDLLPNHCDPDQIDPLTIPV